MNAPYDDRDNYPRTGRRLGIGSAWRAPFQPYRDCVPTALVYMPDYIGYLNGTFYVDAAP